jgi:hypothetical protein
MRMLTIGLGLMLAVAITAEVAFAETNYDRAARIAPTLTQATAKKVILSQRGQLFKEPESVRDAKISDPFTCLNGSGNCICIEANARNSYGGYTGIELLGIRIEGNQAEALGKMYAEARATPCGKLVAFPELNGRGKR